MDSKSQRSFLEVCGNSCSCRQPIRAVEPFQEAQSLCSVTSKDTPNRQEPSEFCTSEGRNVHRNAARRYQTNRPDELMFMRKMPVTYNASS